MANKEKQKARAELKNAKRARKAEEKRDKKMYGKGEEGRRAKMAAQAKEAAKKKAARAATRAISSVDTDTSTEGASMKKYGASKPNPNAKKERKRKKARKEIDKTYRKGLKDDTKKIKKSRNKEERSDLLMYSPVADREKDTMRKMGGSMSGEKYDAKEAYNKNLTASARLHYLENERHDKTGGHAIHKHMRNFGASMKDHKMGASMKGTPPGSRMQNLAKKAMNSRPTQYTDSGQNFKDANNNFVSGLQVDEGRLSPVIRKSPMRPHVIASKGALKNQKTTEKLYLTKDKKKK